VQSEPGETSPGSFVCPRWQKGTGHRFLTSCLPRVKVTVTSGLVRLPSESNHGFAIRNWHIHRDWCNSLAMAHFPQTNAFVRAPRINFRRPLSIDFCLGQKNLVRGDLHVVSTTGGRAQTVKPVPEGCIAELRIGSEQGMIRGIAEMLPGRQTIHG